MPLADGQVIQGRYRIIRLLGQGGFGAVYLAWDHNLDAQVAIKESLGAAPAFESQFRREARLLFDLRHPNLPRVHDIFSIPGQGLYLAMDYIEGEDLADRLLRTGKPVSERQALEWTSQVCAALAYLHSQQPPVIHRDVKPANIRITPAGQAILVDFGIAKEHLPGEHTTTGARALSPGYSPQEQYSEGATDARSDIYALGATLYHLLTNRKPPESVKRSLGTPLPLPRQFNPAISEETQAVILRAMELLPYRRFQSAAELEGRLAAILATGLPGLPAAPAPGWREPETLPEPVALPAYPPAAPPTIPPTTAPLPVRRGWIVWGAGLGLVFLGLALAAVLGWLAWRGAAPAQPAAGPILTLPAEATAPVASSIAGPAALTQTPLPQGGAPTPPPRPTDPPANLGQQPEQFVRGYFELINLRRYDQSWQVLSDAFKQKFHCCNRDGSYAFEPYANWNDSIRRIDVLEVRVLEQDGARASLLVALRYTYQDGRVVNDNVRLELASDGRGSWLINDQGG